MQADGTWTVLAVDADASARKALQECLARDYRVLTAGSVRDALATLAAEEIDLVLAAYQLPDASAVDLFREARVS